MSSDFVSTASCIIGIIAASIFTLSIVLLQGLAIKTIFEVRRITSAHDVGRKSDELTEAWRPFIRPHSKTLPPLWSMILRALFVAPFGFVGIILAVLTTSATAFVTSPRNSLQVAHVCGNIVARLAGVSCVEWRGKAASAKEAPLVVANHISWIDFIVLGATIKFGFVMSEGVSKVPLIGAGFTKLAQHVGSIVLDRGDAKSREAAKLKIKEKLDFIQTSNHGERLLVFSEGTLTNGEYVVPFKLGAFESLKPTQPLRLEFTNPHFSLACLGTLEGTLLFLCLGSTQLTFTWGEVVSPSEDDTRGTFAEKVRISMVKGSDMIVAKTGSYRDHLALYANRQLI